MPMAPVEALASASLVQIARELSRRQASPVELADTYTRRIEGAVGLRAYITLPGERARREAKRAERRPSGGAVGTLLGGALAGKDLLATRAHRKTGGASILRESGPSRGARAG